MPNYVLLNPTRLGSWYKSKAEVRPVISSLKKLRKQLSSEIPKKQTGKLLLATWNIRDLGGSRVPMKRLKESFIYMAEIISAFDLVALQEVNKDLKEFNQLRRALGKGWGYFMTDAPDANEQNNERLVYVYDKSKVQFRDIAGEVTLPSTKKFRIPSGKTKIKLPKGSVIKGVGENEIIVGADDTIQVDLPFEQTITASRNFARRPYLASFQSGWFKFNLVTAHIYYGNTNKESLEIRAKEIDRLTKILNERAVEEKELYGEASHFIALGDFNIHRKDHATMKAFANNGFIIPAEIQENPTTMLGTSYYDQIAFLEKPGLFESLCSEDGTCKAGSFDFYKSVYCAALEPFKKENGKARNTRELVKILDQIESEHDRYREHFQNEKVRGYWEKTVGKLKGDVAGMPSPLSDDMKKMYFLKDWRTYQMSDHLPLWVELNVDHTENYISSI